MSYCDAEMYIDYLISLGLECSIEWRADSIMMLANPEFGVQTFKKALHG
jgi:hypothetical protein